MHLRPGGGEVCDVKGTFVFTRTTVIALATDGYALVISDERRSAVKQVLPTFARCRVEQVLRGFSAAKLRSIIVINNRRKRPLEQRVLTLIEKTHQIFCLLRCVDTIKSYLLQI